MGRLAAKRMMQEFGLEDPTEIPLEFLLAGKGAILVEKPLENSEGRIVSGRFKSIITINPLIQYPGKKRFVMALELGDHEMHRNLFPNHHDNEASLEYFKSGNQETEANEFTSELLMPETILLKEITGKKFSPDLIRGLSECFQTSITSLVYKYFELGNHPLCLFYMHNNEVKDWKRPDGYPHFIKNRTRLALSDDSVASEFYLKQKIYPKVHRKQQIWKSTWFELKHWENDNNFKFFEFCIITPRYNTVLSVGWEKLK